MLAPSRWRLSPGARLYWRIWGEECVIFNTESGDTHMLDSVAAYGLACFEEWPHDVESLSLAFGAKFGMEPGPLLRDYIERLIAQLSSLGLIEAHKPDVEESFAD
jgi:PqqD family protein of HPr-rel-A system